MLSVAASLGLRVGVDVAVTGFNGGALNILEPPLTTVRIPVEEVAEALVERLRRELAAGPTGEPGRVVPTTLSVGASA